MTSARLGRLGVRGHLDFKGPNFEGGVMVRNRSRRKGITSLPQILLVFVLATGTLPVWSGSAFAATTSGAACTPAQVTFRASTNRTVYDRGALVRVTVSLRNHSDAACAYVIGPMSPNFVLTNSSGTTVWGSCWFDGRPAPCAMYLLRRSLAPDATYRDELTWNQRTGHPPALVPLGRYRFEATLSGLVRQAVSSFSVAQP